VKVTFLEDVARVARVGQTKEVANGYARNYLLPKKLAVIAESRAAAAVEGQLKKKVKQREIEDAEMAALAKIIEGTEVVIRAKVGDNEKLYGSVTAADVAAALTAAAGREIEKRQVELLDPIRQTGVYLVTVRLAHEITAAIKVKVASEEATEEQIAAMGLPEKPAAEKPEKPAKKPRQKKAAAAEGAEGVEGAEVAEKPARKPRGEKTPAAQGAEAAEKPARKPKAEKPVAAGGAETAEGAEKPARKPKAGKPVAVAGAETAEGAEKPASKPKAKSTRKAKGEAAEAGAPEAAEK
jgi:large subunit ribosomal protein L9